MRGEGGKPRFVEGVTKLAPMLASVHNLHFYVDLMRQARDAIEASRFAAFATQFRLDRQRGI